MKKLLLIILTIIVLNPLLGMKTFADSDKSTPTLLSEAAIMIDAKTGSVLYQKNADAKVYPASLTKIATAIYAIETGNLEDVVTVSKKARNTEGTRVYLEKGEQVTLKKLLQGLLINSGNDAGVAIAEHLSGSVEQFANDINVYLKNVIGIQNTHYENPHGLFDPEHVTTAEDLAKITQYAMKNKVFREIFGTKKLKWYGESWDTTLYTHHKLMRERPYKGVTGGKTGFVDQSGFTLATTAERKDLSLIVITLNSNFQSEAYDDTVNLLNYGFNNFETSTISEGTIFTVNDQRFSVPEKLSYTNRINGKISKKMKKNGELDIVNQSGDVITTFMLDKMEKEGKSTKMTTSRNEVKGSSMLGSYFPDLITLFLTVLIVVLLIRFFWRKFKLMN
ncbi:D-alanyl-D-alanine carboxypeptidase family protein [Virgibacillus dakarensis]|uniref:D-alanyl-D-alanine carboxypeptidase family protein n=1 Tax=Virgibacillus dakarensis TaxID=1917889 RepID=UPI001F1D9A94|nr:D-alanyl-D-alanine carboxypeptidase family protein [Virgibacillus dakarensis]